MDSGRITVIGGNLSTWPRNAPGDPPNNDWESVLRGELRNWDPLQNPSDLVQIEVFLRNADGSRRVLQAGEEVMFYFPDAFPAHRINARADSEGRLFVYALRRYAPDREFYAPTTAPERPLPDLLPRPGERPLHFQVGPNAGHSLFVFIEDVSTRALGLRDARGSLTVDVMTEDAEHIAWQTNIVDRALSIVGVDRSAMGAVINRLGHIVDNLAVTYESLLDAEMRIRNVDIAREHSWFIRVGVWRQVAITMLAQANLESDRVLQLFEMPFLRPAGNDDNGDS
jgi:hypothetical protein